MAEPEDYDLEGWVRLYARRLNARWWRWPWLRPRYEVMSGALVWEDEVPWRVIVGAAILAACGLTFYVAANLPPGEEAVATGEGAVGPAQQQPLAAGPAAR